MKRKSNDSTVTELIDLWLRQYGLNGRYKEFRLLQSWSEVMGPMIANRTDDIRIYEGVLYIQLSSATLRTELGFAKAKIIQSLNDKIGEIIVKDIVFR
ncbi:MAG: hypothetical protein RLZZ543_440 [Bacteroidota bacterium]|jgi:hypothetical protein